MQKIVFSTYGMSPALLHARNALEQWGYTISADPTQATCLLLPVPSGDISGKLPPLRSDVTIFGGFLPPTEYAQVDLLQDNFYLTENAAITAQCALLYADIRPGTRVLVIGWGRIGKHLTALLMDADADVTVAVRKQQDLDALAALGIAAVEIAALQPGSYDVIYNTAPAPVLQSNDCKEDATLVDLASVPGILGEGVIWARGLPGKDAPDRSGILIAKTVLRYALGKE